MAGRCKMPRPVLVHVTDRHAGTALVVPYSREKGRDNSVRYEVPLYRMTVSGSDDSGEEATAHFKVIRFGVLSRGGKHSVVGLADRQTHTLTRVGYMKGSWRITGNHLIHDGADRPGSEAWGAIGCIEVTGVGEWQRFERIVRKLSGTQQAKEIGRAGTLTGEIDAAIRPRLKRAR